MSNSQNAAAVLGRIALALIFVMSGAGKLAAQEATLGYIASSGIPFPVVALWGAIALELFGGDWPWRPVSTPASPPSRSPGFRRLQRFSSTRSSAIRTR